MRKLGVPLVSSKLLILFFVVTDIDNLVMLLLPLFLTPVVNCVFLRRGESVIHFLSNLEFEGKWDARFFGGALSFFRWIVGVLQIGRLLLLLPASKDDGPKGGFPGIGTICLQRRKFPLLIEVEFQLPVCYF